MDPLSEAFDERLQELDAYLDLLDALERQVQTGPPMIGGSTITAQQQKILYSAVYLQLYNLVEATVTWCVDALTNAAGKLGNCLAGDLAVAIRREWIRAAAQTHLELNKDNRWQATVALCDHIIKAQPVPLWVIERTRAGSWDDYEIENISKRLGCDLRIRPDVESGIKRKVRDDKRPLELVKDFRNRLAHGSLSFAECGEGVTVTELRDIKDKTSSYLREVLAAYRRYIDAYEFLIPERRPSTSPPP